jgi:hypothetical protein
MKQRIRQGKVKGVADVRNSAEKLNNTFTPETSPVCGKELLGIVKIAQGENHTLT